MKYPNFCGYSTLKEGEHKDYLQSVQYVKEGKKDNFATKNPNKHHLSQIIKDL